MDIIMGGCAIVAGRGGKDPERVQQSLEFMFVIRSDLVNNFTYDGRRNDMNKSVLT